MSATSELQKSLLFHFTEDTKDETTVWMDVIKSLDTQITEDKVAFAKELTLLAAAEYAAFFVMIESEIRSDDAPIQVDARAARAAQARFDSPPTWCRGIERFVEGEAKTSELFLFTSDVQKIEEAGKIDASSPARDLPLESLIEAIEIYQGMLAETWIGREEVALQRIFAVWLARWTTNKAPDLSVAGDQFNREMKRHPQLFGLMALA